MNRLIFAALLVVAVFTITPTANADPAIDRAFLQVISEHGISYTTPAAAIGAAHYVCGELFTGTTPLAVSNEIQYGSGLPKYKADYFMAASVAAFCPELIPNQGA